MPAQPLPTIEAEIAELPDLRDSWAWAHVQRATGAGTLPGGAEASAAAVARLICPRRLLGGGHLPGLPRPRLRLRCRRGARRPPCRRGSARSRLERRRGRQRAAPRLPPLDLHHRPGRRLRAARHATEPADPEALRVASARPIDVRAPWPGDRPLAAEAQLVGVQGALVPFEAPPAPAPAASSETLAAFDRPDSSAARRPGAAPARDAPWTRPRARWRRRSTAVAMSRSDLVEADPQWLGQLNTSIADRIAAGLGASYVRANQEDLMAKAWQQVGAIREANRLRAVVELTTEVGTRLHDRHVAPLAPGEVLALAAPASARTKTSASTTLAMETRMSRMANEMRDLRLRPPGQAGSQARATDGRLGQVGDPEGARRGGGGPCGRARDPRLARRSSPPALARDRRRGRGQQLVAMAAMARCRRRQRCRGGRRGARHPDRQCGCGRRSRRRSGSAP